MMQRMGARTMLVFVVSAVVAIVFVRQLGYLAEVVLVYGRLGELRRHYRIDDLKTDAKIDSNTNTETNTNTNANTDTITNAVTNAVDEPCLVHQVWKSANVSTFPVRASVEAWQAAYPECRHTLWTDEQLDRLVLEHYPWLYSAYSAFPFPIQRADVARLVLLHHYGGIYADLDVDPTDTESKSSTSAGIHRLRAFDAVIPMDAANIGLTNHFLVARKHSRLLSFLLHRISTRNVWIFLPYLRIMYTTGPLFVSDALLAYAPLYAARNTSATANNILLLSNNVLNTFANHRIGRSWTTADGHALNFLADHWLSLRVYFLMAVAVITLLTACFLCKYRMRGFLIKKRI